MDEKIVKDSQGLAKELVNDTISRQAAIDAVKKNTFRLTFAEEQNCEGHLAWSANAVYSDVIEGALLELPSAQPETTERTTETAQNVSDRDLISRKAAIDALGERPMVWVESDYELGARNQYDADVLALETVPSAQEKRTDKRTEMHACDLIDRQPSSSCSHENDTISRTAAIDAIGKKSDEIYKTKQKGATYPHDDFFQGMAYAESVVKELPSAQPERIKGRWIDDGPYSDNFPHHAWHCSECEESVIEIDKPWFKFCPNCGARMENSDERFN